MKDRKLGPVVVPPLGGIGDEFGRKRQVFLELAAFPNGNADVNEVDVGIGTR